MPRYLRIANTTRGTTVADRCRVASSLRDRAVGLLGTREVLPGEGLFIERSPSIHMFFMRYPIDVVFVDPHGRVTRTVSRLRPWRVVWWARGARDCIELRGGALADSRTIRGDQLRFEETR
ncbi:MAG TPA: DUF192 domain-containing protein [Candidatus Limnocylindria bacterium]|nr:DUF192 domain-containing protein [Candidatus Limnocylindria bacterium]